MSLPAAACRYYFDDALPRSPGSRAKDVCERAEVFDPGRKDGVGLIPWTSSSWPSAGRRASAPPFGRFSRLNAPAHSPCLLRFTDRVTPVSARNGIPGDELLPGQDLLIAVSDFTLSAHLLSLAGLPAHPTPGRCSACGLRSSAPPKRGWLRLADSASPPRGRGWMLFTVGERADSRRAKVRFGNKLDVTGKLGAGRRRAAMPFVPYHVPKMAAA